MAALHTALRASGRASCQRRAPPGSIASRSRPAYDRQDHGYAPGNRQPEDDEMRSAKSHAVAAGLEVLVPGLGFLYAGSVALGVFLLVGTCGAAVGAYLHWADLVRQAGCTVSGLTHSCFGLYFLPGPVPSADSFVNIAVGVAIGWILVRTAWAASRVSAHNQVKILTPTPSELRPSSGMRTLVTIILEMIPGGLGPYGIGDIVTFIEGLFGRTLDGLVLTGGERLIYFIASLIPVVPARPFIGLYRWIKGK
jgi:hypothetical protein